MLWKELSMTDIYHLQLHAAISFLEAFDLRKLDTKQQSMLFLLRDMIFLGLLETAYITIIDSKILRESTYGVVENEIRNIVNE